MFNLWGLKIIKKIQLHIFILGGVSILKSLVTFLAQLLKRFLIVCKQIVLFLL